MESKHSFESLVGASHQVLNQVFEKGHLPQIEHLLGFEFNGVNTNPITKLLGIKKFIKVFDTHDEQGYYGYNLVVLQNPIFEAHYKQTKRGKEQTEGYFLLHKAGIHPSMNNAIVIDYQCNLNPPLEPARLLIDYLVQVNEHDNDLYLGKAFLRLFGKQVFVSYFVLKRGAELVHPK